MFYLLTVNRGALTTLILPTNGIYVDTKITKES